MRFDNSFSFIFSPRPGTPAANLHDDTPHEVKLRRLHRAAPKVIIQNIKDISLERVGTTSACWWRELQARQRRLMGRTECNRVVNFPGSPRLIGQLIDVRITEAMTYTLRGEVANHRLRTCSLSKACAPPRCPPNTRAKRANQFTSPAVNRCGAGERR